MDSSRIRTSIHELVRSEVIQGVKHVLLNGFWMFTWILTWMRSRITHGFINRFVVDSYMDSYMDSCMDSCIAFQKQAVRVLCWDNTFSVCLYTVIKAFYTLG